MIQIKKKLAFIPGLAKKIHGLSRWKKALILSGVLMFIFGVYYVVKPDDAIAGPRMDKVYRIKSNYSGKYLDVKYSSFENSERVQLFNKYDIQLNQMFRIEPAIENGFYKIRNINSFKVFDLWGSNNKQNEIAIQYDDKNTPNQQFAFEEQDGGHYKIKVRHSGQYLTIKGDSRDSGAELVQWSYKSSGVNNQDWTLEEVTNPYKTLNDYLRYKHIEMRDQDTNRVMQGAKALGFTEDNNAIIAAYEKVKEDTKPQLGKFYRIKSRYSNLYFDVDKSSLKGGAHIQQWIKNIPNSMNQLFRIEPTATDDYYKIISVGSNMVLDVYGASDNKNEAIIQYNDSGKANQQFVFELQKGGAYKIKVKHSSQYLTIKEDSRSAGAWIVQWPYKTSGADNQAWFLEEVPKPYVNLDTYLEKRVLDDHVIGTPLLLTGAKGLGFDVDDKTVENKVNALLDVEATRIFADKTGFITTFGMLNKTVDQIAFAGAHNAFSNNQDRRSSLAWDTYKTDHNIGTENHNISIKTMLEVGYRVIDLDIGNNGNGNTGSYHRYRLSGYSNLYGNNAILPKIKAFLDENPNEIAIIHLSDVYNGTIDLTKLKSHSIYHKGEENYNKQVNNMMEDMRRSELLDMTYNFQGNNNTSHEDLYKNMKTPGNEVEWPTLKSMLQSNKRLLFLERDTGVAKDIWFKNQNGDPNNTTKENLDLNTGVINDLKGGSAKKWINITFTEDWGASAGDINAAKINNNGRRIYEILNKADTILRDNQVNKVVNVVYVDYATGNDRQGGWIQVSPVGAVNRANYHSYDYLWNTDTAGKWYWQ